MLPWTDIPVPDPQAIYNYRLADIDHPYEFFWARDRNGAYVFRFKGRFPLERLEEAPRMSGISTSGDGLEGWSYFDLTLDDVENGDLFLTLCRSLMSATTAVGPDHDTAALEIIMSRLRRWQDLLRSGKGPKLSVEAQLGLFGELLILRDVFVKNLEPFEAVSCWNGPLGDEQDFGYSDSLVEVKSARSTRDQAFTVSSLAQLDTTSGRITLAFQTLGVFENDPPNGVSLNDMVDDVRTLVQGNSAAVAELDIRLTLSNYARDPEYDRVHFVPVSRRLFEVMGDFPRIEVSDVRPGISKGSYRVEVNQCLPFEIEPDAAISRILEGADAIHLGSVEVAAEELVRLDESSELEFKSSLRWSYRDSRVDTTLEFVVLKTVSAFANSRGGRLVIGVDDRKNVLGLESDYSTLKVHPDRDGFEQHLFQLLTNAFGPGFCTLNVSVTFPTVAGKEICIVQVKRVHKIVPVEKTDKTGARSKAFYVRTGNTSRELGPDEIIAYHESRE